MKNKSVGIIAEYNPFHNGHLYHLEQSRQITGAEVAVVALSGNFVQRGQIAVADKWERAEAAARCGADLVVEIPTVFACNSAAYFAEAGVKILENLGVDYISFGSESGNIEALTEISREIKGKEQAIEEAIKAGIKEGLSYPRARGEAVARLLGRDAADIIENPNNILALEYIKAMTKARPVTVKRNGPGYNDEEAQETMASATAIRKLRGQGEDISHLMPEASASVFINSRGPSETLLFDMIRHTVMCTSAEELDRTFAGGEGLGNKVKNIIRKASSYEDLIQQLKSKRYTRTRIERFLMQMLLKIESINPEETYIRVLAFSDKGSAYLKEIKKSGCCKLPIITNINKELEAYPHIHRNLEKDILASDIYNLVSGRELYLNSDYVKKPIKISLTK